MFRSNCPKNDSTGHSLSSNLKRSFYLKFRGVERVENTEAFTRGAFFVCFLSEDMSGSSNRKIMKMSIFSEEEQNKAS